jgi:lipopolysaccharide export system permease protein
MKVLTRYLLVSHVGPFVFAFVALTGVILINTLAKEMAKLAGKGLPLGVVAEFFVLSLPANVALTLPMSMLVAVLYTFSQMAAENEITALRASGVDLRRAIVPLVVAAILIAGGMIWFNNRVLPEANFRWRLLMSDVAQTSPLVALREQTLNPIRSAEGGARYFLRSGRVDARTSRLWDVTIVDMSAPNVSRTIYADSGRMALTPAGTDMVLTLHSGTIREVDFSQPEVFQRMSFEEQVLTMTGVRQQLERTAESSYRTDRDMTVGMMSSRVDSLRMQLAELRSSEASPAPPSTGLGEDGPLGRQSRIKNLEYQIRTYRVEIQKKFAIAIATLVFVLIGVPIALRFPRGGVGMVIAVSIAVFGVYYVGLIGGESLADEGYMPPLWSMWATNVVMGTLGLYGMTRIGREHSTGRGGGWGDLPKWLRWPRIGRLARRAEAET